MATTDASLQVAQDALLKIARCLHVDLPNEAGQYPSENEDCQRMADLTSVDHLELQRRLRAILARAGLRRNSDWEPFWPGQASPD